MSGSYAYLIDYGDTGLHVIDVSNPALPVQVGGSTQGGWRLQVSGTRAYVANGYGGLEILDVSNPALPGALGNYQVTPSGPAIGVAISGGYAFVASGKAGLQIVDIADPTSPQVVGVESSIAGETVSLATRGNQVFLAEVSGLRVIDAADPAHPTALGFCPTKGEALGVAVSGNHALVAAGAVNMCAGGCIGSGGLQVIDISNLANPQQVTGFDYNVGFRGVTLSGSYAYVFGRSLQVFDVTDPFTPVMVSETDALTGGLVLSGSYAYVLASGRQLKVYDVSDPATLVEMGTVTSGPNPTYGLAVLGHYALVTDGIAGLQIIDVAEPSNPQLAGNFATASAAWDVAASGNLAYVAVRDAGVQVIDLTDPVHPLPYAKLDTDGDSVAVTVASDLIYVADASKGLKVLRLPGPDLAYQRSGYSIAFSWPASATGFVLQSATTLTNSGDWQDATNAPTEINGQNVVTLTTTEARGFFRLRGP